MLYNNILENIFETENITYGFGSFTQDDFCSAIIFLLGVICVLFFTKCYQTYQINKKIEKIIKAFNENNKKADDISIFKIRNNTTDTINLLEDISKQLQEISSKINKKEP